MRRTRTAAVGVAEHSNSAVLVTIAAGELLDRRHVELTERGLPTHPHHHEGSWAVGRYRKNPKTGKRRNLGTFATREAAEKHERTVQYFKRH